MPKCKKCGTELEASVWVHEPFVWGNGAAIPPGGQSFQVSANMCWHDAEGGPFVVIEQQELATLHERLAAAEQREQQARAVIHAFMLDYELWQNDDPDDNSPEPAYVMAARAWLADRAEQRAEDEDDERTATSLYLSDDEPVADAPATEQEASHE